MKAVIIAGGFGTRMLPISKTIPKEMLPVGDKPIIQYTVESLVHAGITDIIMVTSQQKKALEDYFDTNYQLEDVLKKKGKQKELESILFPTRIAHYSFVKQLEVAGTGNALLYAQPFISDDYFMVIFPDTIYPPETFDRMVRMFATKKSSLVAVHEVPKEEVYKYGVVALDADRVIDFVEKPSVEQAPSSLIWNGAAILHRDIFSVLRNIGSDGRTGELHIPDAIREMLSSHPTYALVSRPYLDTGTIQGLMEANAKLYAEGFLFPPLS